MYFATLETLKRLKTMIHAYNIKLVIYMIQHSKTGLPHLMKNIGSINISNS